MTSRVRLVGASAAWLATVERVTRWAQGSRHGSLLLLGETGTGKNELARHFHHASERKSKAFVEVLVPALSPTVIESELFGHEKGSFTGALNQRVGFFQQADGGTLFLDEIGELGLDLQTKLLGVLGGALTTERVCRRVGDTELRTFDVRVVAATNRDLQREVHEKRFREDLYHRLAELEVRSPPLRVRGDDVLLLAEHILTLLNVRNAGASRALAESAKRLLREYPLPGNVRELSSMLSRAHVFARTNEIRDEDLRQFISPEVAMATPSPSDVTPDAPILADLLEQLSPDATFKDVCARIRVHLYSQGKTTPGSWHKSVGPFLIGTLRRDPSQFRSLPERLRKAIYRGWRDLRDSPKVGALLELLDAAEGKALIEESSPPLDTRDSVEDFLPRQIIDNCWFIDVRADPGLEPGSRDLPPVGALQALLQVTTLTDDGDAWQAALLVGENGTGKTTTLGLLAHELRKTGRPVRVARYPDPVPAEVEGVLILDAIDEVDFAPPSLSQLLQPHERALRDGRLRVVISTRHSTLPALLGEDHSPWERRGDPLSGLRTKRTGYRVAVLHLRLLDLDDVRRYLDRRGVSPLARLMIERLYPLGDLVRRFFFLAELCSFEPAELEGLHRLSGAFERILRRWIERELTKGNRQGITPDEFHEALKVLGAHAGERIDDEVVAQLLHERGLQNHDVLADLILKFDVIHEGRFTHAYVRQYLQAQAFVDWARTASPGVAAPTVSGPDLAFRVFCGELLEGRRITTEAWQSDALLEVVRSQGLSATRAQLSGRDLSGVDLSGMDLREADLRGCDLHDADLSGTDLTNARLDGADLRGARLGPLPMPLRLLEGLLPNLVWLVYADRVELREAWTGRRLQTVTSDGAQEQHDGANIFFCHADGRAQRVGWVTERVAGRIDPRTSHLIEVEGRCWVVNRGAVRADAETHQTDWGQPVRVARGIGVAALIVLDSDLNLFTWTSGPLARLVAADVEDFVVAEDRLWVKRRGSWWAHVPDRPGEDLAAMGLPASARLWALPGGGKAVQVDDVVTLSHPQANGEKRHTVRGNLKAVSLMTPGGPGLGWLREDEPECWFSFLGLAGSEEPPSWVSLRHQGASWDGARLDEPQLARIRRTPPTGPIRL